MRLHTFPFLVLLSLVPLVMAAVSVQSDTTWSPDELKQLRSLSISSLEPLAPDPSNRVADDDRAAQFGQRLFFDRRLSSNGEVSCASCHLPGKLFQDGTPLAKGVGTTDRRTMSVIGTARSAWQFWDGRKDSQWAQALGPLESAVEHGGDRTQYAHIAAEHYRAEYEAIFGKMPDLRGLPRHAGPVQDAKANAEWQAMPVAQQNKVTTVFANLGKAIAAYERKLEPGRSRFDAYADAVVRGDAATAERTLTRDEVGGLKLFLGKGQCVQCHSGALLTNNEFHNTGVPAARHAPADDGRLSGARQVVKDEFNCLSRYSDAKPEQCSEIRFLGDNASHQRQFRVPSLRNVAGRAPYMHAGQFATLREALQHYNRAPAAPAGHSELKPLGITDQEIDQLAAFLATLSGPVNADAKWLDAPRR